jgi:cytochrome P450
VALLKKEKWVDLHLVLLVVAHLPASEATLVWAVPLVLEAPARLEALLEDQPAVPLELEVPGRLAALQGLEDLLVVPLVLEDPDRLGVLLAHLATSKEKIVSMEPPVLVLEPLARSEAQQALEDLAALAVQLV